MSMIVLEGVHKTFGHKHVLKGIDLSVEKGTSLVVIGGSGSGKSVLLKHILGLHKPDKGKVFVDGQDVTSLKEREHNNLMHKFGMLFQGGALFDSLPVWENVAFGLIQGEHMPRKKAYGIALEKLRSVGLSTDVGKLYPSELSGGMQKRVSLARAIATNPAILLFDEPTTGLDPIMADVINNLIVKCSKELGATTISITHDMASARKIADKAAMLYDGKIILEKHIPIGAGLGGGSSDAATILHMLSWLWNITLTPERLHTLALSLGADVPVCLHQAPAFVSGIGEITKEVDALPAIPVVLVNPLVFLSTPAVFQHQPLIFSPPLTTQENVPPSSLKALYSYLQDKRNDLTNSATGLLPVIGEILATLSTQPGCSLARMTGSGATCFGLFSSPLEAQHAATAITTTHPDWWIRNTVVLEK